jgi:hypothetical protein
MEVHLFQMSYCKSNRGKAFYKLSRCSGYIALASGYCHITRRQFTE